MRSARSFPQRGGCWLIVVAAAMPAAGYEPSPTALEQRLLAEPIATLAVEARAKGNPRRGAELFHGQRLACLRCHSVGVGESPLGPDLTRLPADVTAEHLAESILFPSRSIRRGYESVIFALTDGTALTAFLIEETAEAFIIRDVGQQGRRRTLPRSLVEAKEGSPLSIMPTAQVNLLASREEFLDLVAYLLEISQGGPERALALRPAGAPSAPPPTAPDTSGSQPQVYRTMMPESGPGSLAIGLGHDVWVCFDPNRGGIDYAWLGALDLSPTVAEKINRPANVEGRLFYRDARTNPWRIENREQASSFRFRGYRFVERGVTLLYEIGNVAVSEHVAAFPDGGGITRRLEFTGAPASLWLQTDAQPDATIAFERASREGDSWHIDLRETTVATMRIRAALESP